MDLVVIDVASTTLAAALSLLLAWIAGPLVGRLAVGHRVIRLGLGLLTELRMLPVLVALVPLFEARLGLPAFVIVGLLGAASRSAAVARFVARTEGPFKHRALGRRRFWEPARPGGAARAALFLVVPEIALLEGLRTFFSEGRGQGLGAALAHGQLLAVAPLLALTLACALLLERPLLSVARPSDR